MGEFLQRLFRSDFMPHGDCWKWEPWVVWTNVQADSAIFLSDLVIGATLLRVAARRQDMVSNLVLVLFGAFIVSCGCAHALEVYNTWHGVFRLSGLFKAITAGVSLLKVVPLLQILPKLMAAPPLTRALAMDAALCCEQQEKRRAEAALPAPGSGPQVRDATVLVVDDEDAMRAVVVIALDRAGLRTLQARDGREALAVYHQHRKGIRLILMDLTMPNMDGVEACRELRRQGATVPVILTSGFNETEALSRFEDLGLAGFLQKPFGLGRLVEVVRKVLAT